MRVSAEMPDRFQRVQVLLRLGIGLVFWLISNNLLLLGFLLGPVVSAILIGRRGGERFHERYGMTYAKVVAFQSGLQGYLFYATDEFPSWGEPGAVRYEYRPTGMPTVGSALLRIVYVIPHVIVLAIVGFLALLLGLIATITVLINESVGREFWRILVGFVAWEARVLTYYLSMVEEYPPFSLNFDESAVSG